MLSETSYPEAGCAYLRRPTPFARMDHTPNDAKKSTLDLNSARNPSVCVAGTHLWHVGTLGERNMARALCAPYNNGRLRSYRQALRNMTEDRLDMLDEPTQCSKSKPSQVKGWSGVEKRLVNRKACSDSPSWLAISGTIFSVLGAVGTGGWLYPAGRGWSSIPAYFDPWHHPVTVIVLLGVGTGLALLSEARGDFMGKAWVLASRRIASIAFGVGVFVAVVVPVVIWVVKVLIWILIVLLVAGGLLVLYNLDRISRGRKPYWPRSPWGLIPWIRKALVFVPFGG